MPCKSPIPIPRISSLSIARPFAPRTGCLCLDRRALLSTSSRTRPPLAYAHLGTLPYSTALDLQNALVKKRLEAIEHPPGPHPPHSSDIVLFLQHPHVYTAGRRIRGQDDTEGKRLRALGAEYHEIERGGQVTYHGPGQLVGYPILNLKEFGLTTREYVRLLEKCMSALSARFGIPATTNDSNIGVWIGENKIGAVGVQSSRGVTAHGFALNCSTDLAWFDRIVPCGLADKGVTSLTAEIRKSEDLKRRIGDVVTVEMVLPLAIRTLGEVLERDMVPVEQSEPELAEFVQRFLKGKR